MRRVLRPGSLAGPAAGEIPTSVPIPVGGAKAAAGAAGAARASQARAEKTAPLALESLMGWGAGGFGGGGYIFRIHCYSPVCVWLGNAHTHTHNP